MNEFTQVWASDKTNGVVSSRIFAPSVLGELELRGRKMYKYRERVAKKTNEVCMTLGMGPK